MPQLKEELYYLRDSETGVTGSDIATASIFQQGWKYQVPTDKKLTFRPGHSFSAYLENNEGTPAELAATDRVRIWLQDPNQQTYIALLQDTVYARLKEFADRDKVCRLDITTPHVAQPLSWVIIEVYTATSLDASDCYWVLTSDLTRLALKF